MYIRKCFLFINSFYKITSEISIQSSCDGNLIYSETILYNTSIIRQNTKFAVFSVNANFSADAIKLSVLASTQIVNNNFFFIGIQ